MTKSHRSHRRLSATSKCHLDAASACVVQPIERLERRVLLAGDDLFPGRSYDAVDAGPRRVISADLNSDGNVDLVTVNASGNSVTVLRNLGDGTFASGVTYPAGLGPRSVAAADIDGDGHLDLVTASFGETFTVGNKVSVLRNLGNGTFAAAVDHEVLARPTSLAAADVDGDGDIDLVTTHEGASAGVVIRRNNGDGTFAAMEVLPSGGTTLSFVVASDLDRDGDVDLVASTTNGTVRVLRNNGNGTFEPPISYVVNRAGPITAADLNGDGDADLAIVKGTTIGILRNNGNGTFAYAPEISFGYQLASIASGDLDGDGDLDLVAAGETTIELLLNTGNGTFAPAVSRNAGSLSWVIAADVDRDGTADVVSNSVTVWRSVRGRTPFMATSIAGPGPWPFAAADLDGDGDLDLVRVSGAYSSVSVLLNSGDATFAAAGTYLSNADVRYLRTADLDNDGHIDIIAASHNGNRVTPLRNLGNGTFSAGSAYTLGSRPSSVTAADLDGDGDVDLVTTNESSNTVTFLRNQGDGMFAAGVDYAVGLRPVALAAVDLDGDGLLDLVAANRGAASISILYNKGNGSFSAGVATSVGFAPSAVTAADIDGDGDIDLITSSSLNYLTVLRNRGDGTLTQPVLYYAGSSPLFVVAADIDGDGDIDLLAANSSGNSIAILHNDGTGRFSTPIAYQAGRSPRLVTAADLDGDGDLDLIASNDGGEIIFLPNQLGDAPLRTTARTFAWESDLAVGIRFNRPLDAESVQASDLIVKNLTTGQTFTASGFILENSGRTLTFELPTSLPAGDYRFTLPAGSVTSSTTAPGPMLSADEIVEDAILPGDANRDRAVDLRDLWIVTENYGQTGRTFSQGNLDYSPDGLVGFSDLLILAQNYNASLIRAEPKPSVFASRATTRRSPLEADDAALV